MEIFVNGKPHTVEADITVAGLIKVLDITAGRIAVERNRDIVPRAEHGTTKLAPGDRIEIVTFVGGD